MNDEINELKAFEDTHGADEAAAAVPQVTGAPEKAVPVRPRRKKRRPWGFPLGVAVIVLSIIGAITVVSSAVGFIRTHTDKSAQLEKYNEYLAWVVANDPDSFDDITKANPEQLREIAILSLLYDDLSTDDYELSPEGLLIPAYDVETYYKKYFGTSFPIQHGNVSGLGYSFTYDAGSQLYTVPLTGVVPPFSPRVVSFTSSRGAVVLTVGYISGGDLSVSADGKLTPAEPVKYMKITLRREAGDNVIAAIQATTPPETAE